MTDQRFQPLNLLRAALRPIDPLLFALLAVILGYAFVLMQSASPERIPSLVANAAVALAAMWLAARLSPQRLLALALPLYAVGVLLLVAVDLFGETSKGATRWLDIGITRIQPSELMKIAMPLMLAWYFQQREGQIGLRDFIVAARTLLEGDTAESLAAVGRVVASDFRDPEGLFYLSRHLAHLNETGPALDLFARVVAGGFFCFPAMARDPWLDPLRKKPAFTKLLREAEGQHREALSAFERLGGDKVLGAASSPLTRPSFVTANADTTVGSGARAGSARTPRQPS